MFFLYQSDQKVFGDQILTYEQQDEDGQDVNDGQGAVPPPKQLTLERQLNKSILIG